MFAFHNSRGKVYRVNSNNFYVILCRFTFFADLLKQWWSLNSCKVLIIA